MPRGVSVVIPSFRGAEAAATTLASLDAQTLDADRFEVVLVVNGPAAADLVALEKVRRRYPRLTVRIVATSTAGASLAWNLGVQAARMEWLTFVDDDDAATPTFLSGLLDAAVPGVVPLAQIHDVHADGAVDRTTALNAQITSRSGTAVTAAAFPQALGFNAAKLIPTRWAQASAYDRRMTNGQDVAYFADISLHHDVTFAVVPAESEAAYLRGMSDTSMSRQAASFEFSVEQRLHVIERIDRARRRSRPSRRAAADHLIRAQVHMMNRYLVEHPERRGEAVAATERRRLGWFPYADLNRDLATRLVFVLDGEAAGRRTRSRLARLVAEWGEPVDVVAVARPRPARSWVTDFWRDRDLATFEGRLIRVSYPTDEAADLVEGVVGSEPAYRELVSISRSHAPRGVAAAFAARRPGLRLSWYRPGPLTSRWRRS